MDAQLRFSGRTGRRALLSLLATVALWLTVGAVQAHAANLTVFPQIKGPGSISTSGYSCSGPSDDRVIIGCPSRAFDSPFFGTVTFSLTPSAFAGADFVGWEGCQSVSGTTCSMTANIFQNLVFVPRAVFDDSTAPTMSVLPIFSTGSERTVSFFFGASGVTGPLASAQCRMDGGPIEGCSSGRTYTLAEGPHIFEVRGIDASGNLGGFATSGVFKIIDTAIVSGPANGSFVSSKSASFTYSTGIGGDGFQCSLDGAAFSACGTKNASGQATLTPALSGLSEGTHTFRVRGVSGAFVDQIPAIRTWTVDTIAPTVTSLSSPTITEGVVTTALNATFTFATSEAPANFSRFECKLDNGEFETCTSGKTYSDLSFGERTFTVRGRDKANNVGPEVKRTWTVAARDNDGDGFNQRSDCNDDDPRINPIAPDVPDNGVDENCDGADAINLDRDADGFQRPADCDDANPSIKPGVRDIPDNNIDENCDGSDAKSTPPTRIVVSMPFFVKKSTNKFTTFTQLQVKGIPQGSRLKVVCKAPKKKKCPAGNTFTKRNAGGTVNLSKWLKKKLLAGTTLTVTVTKPGNFIGAVKTMTIKKKARPSFVDRCAAPGTTKAIRC
ncbi:MAG TPA: putative metal-binding motif-containing protein [Solirubrobacteraceae bacterium]|nr:putative metal-binding motif-containing protein [Solirubrobacteraceae bacterium]